MKRFTGLLCILMLVTSLTALSAGGVQETASSKVDLTVWSYPRFIETGTDGEALESGSFEKRIIAEFMEEHPDVTVTLEMIPYSGGPEKVKTAIAGKNPPDVLVDYIGRIAEYSFMDVLVPLDDMLSAEDRRDIPESIISLCSVDGSLVMYPWGSMPIGWIANKALFDKAESASLLPLDRESRDWSIEEAEAAMTAVASLEDTYAMALWAKDEQADSTMRLLLQNFGADIYNADYSGIVLDSPAGVEGLEWILEMTDAGVFAPGAESASFMDTFSLFTSGKTAIMPLGTAAIFAYLENMVENGEVSREDMDPVVIAPPVKAGVDLRTDVQAHGICIFDNGDKQVIEMGKLLTEKMAKEYQREGNLYAGTFPVRKSESSLYENPEVAILKYMIPSASETGLKAPYYAEMRAFFYPQFQAALTGQKSAAQALQDFAQKTNEMLAEN